jgi:hypothetical protein
MEAMNVILGQTIGIGPEFWLVFFSGWAVGVLCVVVLYPTSNKQVKPECKQCVWNRPQVITHTSLGPVLQLPVPAKRRFREFLNYLKDAEKADVDGDNNYRDHMLVYLKERIDESLKGKDAEE